MPLSLARWSFALTMLAACADSVVRVEHAAVDAATLAECDGAAACDDGLFCNGAEQCEQGRCVAGAAPSCDDGVACTRDGCNESRGCVHLAYDVPQCRSGADAGSARDASAQDAGTTDTAEASVLAPPTDPARPADVGCPTSVRAIYAETQSALEAYGNVSCVAGDVKLGPMLTDLSALSNLRWIGGSFDFTGAAAAFAGLVSLERIDGNTTLGQVADADGGVDGGMDLPSLAWVGGALNVRGALSPRGLAALRRVGGALTLATQPKQGATQALAGLRAVGGTLLLDGSMPDGFPALEWVGGDVQISAWDPHSLEPLPRLREIGGSLQIANTKIDQVVSLPALAGVAGWLTVMMNPDLPGLELPQLTSVDALSIRGNPRLSRCQVDAIQAQLQRAGFTDLCCNQGCERCDGSECVEPGAITAGQATHLTGDWYFGWEVPLVCLRSVESAESLTFLNDGFRGTVPMLVLKHVDRLVIQRSPLVDLSLLSSLRSVGTLTLSNNGALRSLHGLEGLQTAREELRVLYNPKLVDVSALDRARGGALQTPGKLNVSNNPALDQCQPDAMGAFGANNRACAGPCNGSLCGTLDADAGD